MGRSFLCLLRAAVVAALLVRSDTTDLDDIAATDSDTSCLLQTSASYRSGAGVKVDNTSRPSLLQVAGGPAGILTPQLARVSEGSLCIMDSELQSKLHGAARNVVQSGLPAWKFEGSPVRSAFSPVVLAYLIQVSHPEQLSVLQRQLGRIYSLEDVFLYLVDTNKLDVASMAAVLPQPLPENVIVRPAAHAEYFYWPRVEVVLQGLESLLRERKWDFVIHLSESCYPVHSAAWIRRSLAAQRGTNFINMNPHCSAVPDSGVPRHDDWFWWTQTDAAVVCGSKVQAHQVRGASFPMTQMERGGFRFARGSEWMILTRELVEYALSPALADYRTVIGTHVGADEMYWQTLVLNIPKFQQTVSQQGWFIQWGHGKTSHSPDTLSDAHEHLMLSQRHKYFFARKVSPLESAHLLSRVDAAIDAHRDSAPGPLPGTMFWDAGAVTCHVPQASSVAGGKPSPAPASNPSTLLRTYRNPWVDNVEDFEDAVPVGYGEDHAPPRVKTAPEGWPAPAPQLASALAAKAAAPSPGPAEKVLWEDAAPTRPRSSLTQLYARYKETQ